MAGPNATHKVLAVRLPRELHKRYGRLAHANHRSLTDQTVKILESLCNKWEQQVALEQRAVLKRMQDEQ